jgi:hypothetical protein
LRTTWHPTEHSAPSLEAFWNLQSDIEKPQVRAR